ncbi:hypothetical protein FACS189498_1940 [Spirochaetia bacterium]|nr:hypothetical protein FACS189498_1940 [Spirochaetia bacterium]
MTPVEKKIVDVFISRYLAGGTERKSLRLRSVSVFPGFDTARPDEKESFLEAAESLERRNIISLKWEKRGKGERLKTLTCENIEKLFEESGRKDPGSEAEEIRRMIKNKRHEGNLFLQYWAENFDAAEIRRGVDIKAVEDIISLVEIFPRLDKRISTRALSVKLYRDSKRLERLLDLVIPVLTKARKRGIEPPDLLSLERSLPDTMISGKIIFEYSPDGKNSSPPLVNAAGIILGFPFSSTEKIARITTIEQKENPVVLTVENKETFYALGDPENYAGASRYDCCLYSGGYPNRAAAALIKILAASGFSFCHSGDLDPGGILILQNVHDIAGKPVIPLRMDTATFDRYLPFARPLTKEMLRQTAKIREDTRAIPGIADLIRRIEETSRGVEQEIVAW